MNMEQALMDEIFDDPTDDTSWLVLADWLENKNQAGGAAMLRLHRQLRSLITDKERKPLEERFQKMLRSGVRPAMPTRTNSIGMELALVPPGFFWLGSLETERGRYPDESPRRLI